jgi:HK97 family phage major capsid protein
MQKLKRYLRGLGFGLSSVFRGQLRGAELWFLLTHPAFVLRFQPLRGADPVAEVEAEIEEARTKMIDAIKEMGEISAEDKQEYERRSTELNGLVDKLADLAKDREPSDEVKAFQSSVEERLEEFGETLNEIKRLPTAEPRGTGEPVAPGEERGLEGRYEGNLYEDIFLGHKGDMEKRQAVREHEAKFRNVERLKLWSTGDLEDVSLVIPEVLPALPFLQAEARIVRLCRELRVSGPSIELPVFTSGLVVDVVDDQATPPETKPESDPTFELKLARVFTVAGTTEVPNSTLEDYAAARGWIATELGRATGIKENRLVLAGTGVGEPTGILQTQGVTERPVSGDTGRDYIEATFRAIQDVRIDGLTEPNGIAMHPAAWTEIVLAFEANVGYLYGPPQGSGFPEGEPGPRLLGLPVTLDAYVSTDYGTTGDTAIIVGNFQDALVLRRSPFRIDVDTSLGFRENTTWFRGEERLGFIVVRPASFKVVTGITPAD